MSRLLPLLLLPLLLPAGCGWGTTDIEAIAADPFRYQSRTVTVQGEVVWAGALPAVGRDGIELARGEARLLVLTARPAPPIGSRLKLAGQVEAEFDLGDRRAPVLIDEEPGAAQDRGRADVR